MMKLLLGSIACITIVIVYLSVFLLTLLPSINILFDKKDYLFKNKIYFVLSLLINSSYAFLFILLHRILVHRWNFFDTLFNVLKFNISNQYITFFAVFFLCAFCASFIISLLFRKLIPLFFKNHYCFSSIEKRKKPFLLLLSVAVCSAVIFLFNLSLCRNNNIYLNEIAANNATMLPDEAFNVSDYIELYNDNFFDCSLTNLYLSDDLSDLSKMSVPYQIIPAKGYLVIKLDNSDMSVRKEGGETVILSDSSGNILDEVTTKEMPKDYSYCRLDDSSDAWDVLSSTPCQNNSLGHKSVALPVLSHSSGFYDNSFTLSISSSENHKIYYTLDGSIPSEESTLYSEPILVYDKSSEPNVYRSKQNVVPDWKNYTPNETPVDKAFIIRAIAVDENGISSEVVTASYFVNLEKYSDKNVISLIVNPDDFWGENGIYVTGEEYDKIYLNDSVAPEIPANFNQHGRDYETEVAVTYISPETLFEQDAGVRISGASTRNYAQKRFSLYARKAYSGSSVFDYDFFNNIFSHKLYLREGYANTFLQDLARDRDIATQYYKPVTVFLNGEYWYDTYLLEAYDSQYFAEHYGINSENVVVYKGNELSEGADNEGALFNEIFSYIENNDISTEKSYREFGEIVDIQSYIDFICFNAYIGNIDFSENHNIIYWRSDAVSKFPYDDGKWRFGLYDLDEFDWGSASRYGLDYIYQKNTFRMSSPFSLQYQSIFKNLQKNPIFKKQFSLTFMDMVNSTFRYENIEKHLALFCQDNALSETQLNHYKEFFKNRPQYVISYMADSLGLSGSLETLTIAAENPEGGNIQLNTIIPDISSGLWSGKYYSDYPVTITAEAKPGYEFVGWTGDVQSNNSTIEIPIEKGGVSINAIFQRTTQ